MIISAVVEQGMQDPHKGFKTANISTTMELGVYICKTNYGNALAVCVRPNKLEVHILGFDMNIYGEILNVWDLKEINKNLVLSIGIIINNSRNQSSRGDK